MFPSQTRTRTSHVQCVDPYIYIENNGHKVNEFVVLSRRQHITCNKKCSLFTWVVHELFDCSFQDKIEGKFEG